MWKPGMSTATYNHISNNLTNLTIDLERGTVTTSKGTNGYLNSSGRRAIKISGKQVYVHQIIAVKAFGSTCVGLEINHINGDPSDNRISNIEIVTRKENLDHQKINKLFRKQNSTNVDMLDLDGNLIKTYDSMADASRHLGIPNYSGISHCVRGVQKTCAGYKWRKSANFT